MMDKEMELRKEMEREMENVRADGVRVERKVVAEGEVKLGLIRQEM